MNSLHKPTFDEGQYAPNDDQVVLCHRYLLGGDSPVWRFYCHHCKEHHTHGCGEGWRVPHCGDRGRGNWPYPQNLDWPYSGGYYLMLDPRAENE